MIRMCILLIALVMAAPPMAEAQNTPLTLEFDNPKQGNPIGTTPLYNNKHTTHFTTADASGYWVACTATINTGFGSKVAIPGSPGPCRNPPRARSGWPAGPTRRWPR